MTPAEASRRRLTIMDVPDDAWSVDLTVEGGCAPSG